MIAQLLSLVVKREMASLKRRSAGGVAALLGVLLIMLALLTGLVSLYLWMSTKLHPWEAALIIAAGLLITGLVMIMAGRSMLRRRRQQNEQIEALTQALMGKTGSASQEAPTVGIVTAAAVVGLLIGRSLGK